MKQSAASRPLLPSLLTLLYKKKARTLEMGKAVSISVINQIVSSGTNFVLGLYLVRVLSPPEFGLYGIGFAISLFYGGIGNALFLTQMVVHTPDKAAEDRVPYAGRMLVLVIMFCTSTLFIVGPVILLGGTLLQGVEQYIGFTTAVMFASITYLLKDFFLRHAYNVRKETWALNINGILAITMVVMLCSYHLTSTRLTVESALWIYAIAQASGIVTGHLLARLPITKQIRATIISELSEAWQGGAWASITNIVYFARTQAHTIVVAALIGPAGIAKLNAGRLLVTPAVMITPALSQVAMPRLATMRASGAHHVIKGGKLILIGLLGIAMLYCSILLAGYNSISMYIFGDTYSDIFAIVLLWCTYTCLLAIRNSAEISAQVLQMFMELTRTNTYSAFLSLIATYTFTKMYGLKGALIGLIIGEIALIIMLLSIFKFNFNNNSN